MISINEEIAVPSPRKRVWEVISSPADVVSCISGAELGEAHDDGSFDGSLVVKFGAIRVRFAARISLELTESEFEGRLSARGGDGQGATRFRGDATFCVVEDPVTGDSLVVMNGEVTLSGKLASLVESGAGVVVSRMTKDFTAKLIQRCTEPAELSANDDMRLSASSPTPTPTPVSVRARTGLLRRLGTWLAHVLLRRQPPPPAPDRGASATPSPRTTPTEEIGSENAPAQ